jgi:DNA-directed RNA polymerase beta' subunit
MVELEEIAAVPHHIITARHAKPIIGIYQDTLVGSYLLTKPGIQFTQREFMNLMMWNKRFDGTMPEGRGSIGDQKRWTGQQVLGALLPPINMELGNKSYDSENPNPDNYVKITQGDITQGTVDGDIYMKPSKGIVHVTYNDYGPKDTVDLLDSLQNTVENFLVLNGFSVGISDLIADEDTKKEIDATIQKKKQQVEQFILQVHLDLFDNNTGKTNQQEFEDQIFGILNQATSDAGSLGQKSLSTENRLLAMVRSGSKGEPLNVAQMMACLGQTAIEGKRVPYGFTDRTLPHYKKYDDSSEARGFIESSFIRGLTPQQFFFHAMSGREGLIDTAVKSVTADTELIIMEHGQTKWTTIGSWIDQHLDGAKDKVEHHIQANMELLQLEHDVFIPTCNEHGDVTWGKLTAVTRHDPGEMLYDVHTKGGRHVTVAKSQSLIVWNAEQQKFLEKPSPEVKVGDYLPTTVQLCDPPAIMTHITMRTYAPKLKGPNYSLPETMELTERNGIFFGLYLAEGNSHLESGYVSIANNDQTIRTFAMEWFQELGINVKERFRSMENKTRTGVTKSESHGVRGFSRLLGQFLQNFLGAGSAHKFVPNEAFSAPKEFIRGLLNGYFSGDGTVDVKKGSITVGSASKRLIDGISFLCSRFGIFGKQSYVQLKQNNVMTPVERILPTYRFAIYAKWATLFAKEIPLISHAKQERLNQIKHEHEHRNFPQVHDVAKDEIVSIVPMSVDDHPKLYDVTVPSTLNFAIANGLHVRDTADTGYIQRQLIKSMEDLVVQHDGTVRDANNNIVQYHYGEDGINPVKIETQSLPIGKLSEEDIRTTYGMKQVDWSTVLKDGLVRDQTEEVLITTYVETILYDQRMMVEGVFQKKSLDSGSVFAPVNLARYILNTKVRFGLDQKAKTDLTPTMVLEGIDKIIKRTHTFHKIWAALLRFHLAPHKLIVQERFTKAAFDMLLELILINHMKSWVQPGDQVGIVAAQSIGEPATQMSEIGSTVIQISDGANLRFYGAIKDFCDPLLKENDADLPDSVVLTLTKDYYIVGVSKDEKTTWRRISEISRHPANGGLVEVVTRTGRRNTATLSHSFLKRSVDGVVPVLGSDLTVGMRIPIARQIPEVPNPIMSIVQGESIFDMDTEFGWVCGMYVADGCFKHNTISISKISPIVEEKLTQFATQYGLRFTTKAHDGQYGPGKDNDIYSKDLKDFLMATFGTGSYEKHIGATAFHANKEFIAGLISGFFDGDGNVSVERQLIRASSRSKQLIQHMTALLGYVGLFGTMSEETSVRIKDKVQHTLVIPRKFAKDFKERVGFHLPEKAEALDEIIAYNAREDAHSLQEMIDKIPELGNVIAETGKLLKMPGQSRTYGRWAKKDAIGRQTLEKYVAEFEQKLQTYDLKDPIHETIQTNMDILRSAVDADVVWDEIVELIYHDDPKEFVYDFTVPGNDSFMVDCNVLVHNTLNKVLLRTGDCYIGCCIPYIEKQCKYNYG